jgi:hypothetical protein
MERIVVPYFSDAKSPMEGPWTFRGAHFASLADEVTLIRAASFDLLKFVGGVGWERIVEKRRAPRFTEGESSTTAREGEMKSHFLSQPGTPSLQ